MHYRILDFWETTKNGDEYWDGKQWRKVVTMFGYPAPTGVQVRRPTQSKTKKIAPNFNAQRVIKEDIPLIIGEVIQHPSKRSFR